MPIVITVLILLPLAMPVFIILRKSMTSGQK